MGNSNGDTEFADVALYIAAQYVTNGEYDEALNIFHKMFKYASSKAVHQFGVFFLRAGETSSALEIFKMLVLRDCTDDYYIGRAAYKLALVEEANADKMFKEKCFGTMCRQGFLTALSYYEIALRCGIESAFYKIEKINAKIEM